MNLRTMPIKTGPALAAEPPAFQERERYLAGLKQLEIDRRMRRLTREGENRRIKRRLAAHRRRQLAALDVVPHPDAAENYAVLEQISRRDAS